MGSITLSLADIEFLPVPGRRECLPSVVMLDDDDVVLLDDHGGQQLPRATPRPHVRMPKPGRIARQAWPDFDDAPTGVWSTPRFARGR